MGAWVSVDIEATPLGLRGRGVILDPDPDFMQALMWALVNRIPFPIPDNMGGGTGLLQNIDTKHLEEPLNITTYGGATGTYLMRRFVEVTVEFIPLP